MLLLGQTFALRLIYGMQYVHVSCVAVPSLIWHWLASQGLTTNVDHNTVIQQMLYTRPASYKHTLRQDTLFPFQPHCGIFKLGKLSIRDRVERVELQHVSIIFYLRADDWTCVVHIAYSMYTHSLHDHPDCAKYQLVTQPSHSTPHQIPSHYIATYYIATYYIATHSIPTHYKLSSYACNGRNVG